MALIPIKTVQFEGETIRHIFFLDIIGGDKMIMVMASNKVVILPIYRECPVQEGTVVDLVADFGDYREKLKEALTTQIENHQALELKLKEIEDGMD